MAKRIINWNSYQNCSIVLTRLFSGMTSQILSSFGSMQKPHIYISSFSMSLAQYLIMVILLTTGMKIFADNSFVTSSGNIIEFKKFDKNYFTTLQYLRHIDATIGRIVKESSGSNKSQKCKFFVSPDHLDGIKIGRINGQITIVLNSDLESWRNDYQTNRKIIGTLLLSRIGIAAERYNEVIPPWILSGFVGLCRQKEFAAKIIDINYLPGLRACAIAGKYPQLRSVLRYPMTPEDNGAAYEFYEEVCRFMLRETYELSSGSENLLRDIVFLTAKNKYSNDEIFNTTLGRVITEKYSRNFDSQLPDQDKIQAWFEYSVKARVISPFSPFTAEQFRLKLESLKQVSCVLKTGNRQNRETFTIDQLPLKFDEIEDKNAVVIEKQRIIEQMVVACPPLLSDSSVKLHNSIASIGNVRKENLSRQINEIIDKLQQQLNTQIAIEKYLEETEFSQIPSALLYQREIKEVSRSIYQPWPNLSNYLSKEERKFLE